MEDQTTDGTPDSQARPAPTPHAASTQPLKDWLVQQLQAMPGLTVTCSSNSVEIEFGM